MILLVQFLIHRGRWEIGNRRIVAAIVDVSSSSRPADRLQPKPAARPKTTHRKKIFKWHLTHTHTHTTIYSLSTNVK